MERMHSGHFSVTSLADEHIHRYQLAARLSKGIVVDCACGIGYGSVYFRKNPAVSSYLGIDPSAEAISYAQSEFSSNRSSFSVGTLEKLPFDKLGSVDTVVSLETLEHVVDPARALRSVRKLLQPNGLLIGSVPSRYYEELCESTYSPNPYHLQRFSVAELRDLLGGEFERHHVMAAEFRLGTLFRSLEVSQEDVAGSLILPAKSTSEAVEGSLFFLAGSERSVDAAITLLGSSAAYSSSISKARSDAEEVKPLREAFRKSESMIADRDAAIRSVESLITSRDEAMASMERLIVSRDSYIRSLEEGMARGQGVIDAVQRKLDAARGELERAIASSGKMIQARDAAIKSAESMIRDRDAALDAVESMVRDRDARIASMQVREQDLEVACESMDAMIRDRDLALASVECMVRDRDSLIKSMEGQIGALHDDALAAEDLMMQLRHSIASQSEEIARLAWWRRFLPKKADSRP